MAKARPVTLEGLRRMLLRRSTFRALRVDGDFYSVTATVERTDRPPVSFTITAEELPHHLRESEAFKHLPGGVLQDEALYRVIERAYPDLPRRKTT